MQDFNSEPGCKYQLMNRNVRSSQRGPDICLQTLLKRSCFLIVSFVSSRVSERGGFDRSEIRPSILRQLDGFAPLTWFHHGRLK